MKYMRRLGYFYIREMFPCSPGSDVTTFTRMRVRLCETGEWLACSARACEAIVGFKVHEADLCVMLQMFSCEFQLFQYTDHFRYIMPIGSGASPSLHPIPFHLGKSCNDVYLGSE